MSKDERITAVYQHACLNKLTGKKTTNSSLRERFKFSSEETTKVGRLITDAVEAERIKLASPNASKRDFHYLPYWAWVNIHTRVFEKKNVLNFRYLEYTHSLHIVI